VTQRNGPLAPALDSLGPRPWLVLGGGGLKGLGHVGAWHALEEAAFRPAGILGTSIGGLVGACLAAGMGWEELAPEALGLKKADILRVNRRALWVNGIRSESVFLGEPLRETIRRILPVRRWDELPVPFQVNAVDLATGETVWFGPGARTDLPLEEAIYASCALPVLYPPSRTQDAILVDGGTLDALPLDRAVEVGATGIVAVDVGAGATADAAATLVGGLATIHQRVFSIMSGTRRREQLGRWSGLPLLLIRPELDGYGTFDFQHTPYFLEEGYRATRGALTRWGVSLPPEEVEPVAGKVEPG